MSRDLDALREPIQSACRLFLQRCDELGFPIVLTQTYRSHAEQAALFAQGRTTPGKVVTNARPGTSPHNYRLAFDVAFRLPGGGVTWDEPEPHGWEMLGALGESLGLRWGGNFRAFPDRPHFEWPTWRELKDRA